GPGRLRGVSRPGADAPEGADARGAGGPARRAPVRADSPVLPAELGSAGAGRAAGDRQPCRDPHGRDAPAGEPGGAPAAADAALTSSAARDAARRASVVTA